ncbi:MAG: type II toxin-antitoxin system RelB/DinJ family antitoxin [Acinetobacter sp.]|nr:MAG: type II toxin-antitoxin system RelB/DinJ family antitoxin [Acinetobacter sp.]
MIHVRVDEQIKNNAGQALAAMGLSISDAVRLLLTRVAADQQFPFALKVPNETTLRAMQEADSIINARFNTAEALFNALEK